MLLRSEKICIARIKRCSARILACAVMIGIVLGVGSLAPASSISAGFDLFETVPTMTSVTIPGPPAVNGGVPFNLLGIPLTPPPLLGVNLGDTDTIVQRTGSTLNLTPPTGTGMFTLQLFALHLQSINPVTVAGQPGAYNVDVIGGTQLGVPESTGTITITQSIATGGTFTSSLPVNANLTFTQVGNPGNTFVTSFFDVFATVNGVWSTTPRSDDAHAGQFQAGGFFAGVNPINGAKALTQEQAMLAMHGVLPGQIPEPASLLLFGIGTIGIGAVIWKSRRRAG
jgi:hypothetical protein